MKTRPLNTNTAASLSRLGAHVTAGDRVLDLSIDDVEEDPDNPRKHFDDAEIAGLAESIRANRDKLVQRIIVREVGPKRWRIVDGARRFRACKLLGMSTVECLVKSQLSSIPLTQLLVNDQHENLTALEIAHVLHRLQMESPEQYKTQDALAKAAGRNKSWVSKHLSLLDLPQAALALAESGRVTDAESLYQLSRLPEDQFQEVLAGIDAGANVRELLMQYAANNRPARPADAPPRPKPGKAARDVPQPADDALRQRVHTASASLGLPAPIVKATTSGVTVVTFTLDADGLGLLERLRPPR